MSETERLIDKINAIAEKDAKLLEDRKTRSLIAKLMRLLPQGPGSGLDADTVDGKHAWELQRAVVPSGGVSGAGGGVGMQTHGNEYHDPDFAEEEHTHTESEITDLDHDAQKIKAKPVDDAAIGDGKVLVYRTAGDKLQYEAQSGGAGHREWNWLDEQSWNRMFYLPLTKKKSGTTSYWSKKGSVLQKGTSGKFDDVGVYLPCVIRVGSYYYLFYTGREGTAFPHDAASGIGVVRFTDPEGAYTRLNNGDPILEPEAGYGYAQPSVIYDQYETDADKKWKMILGKVTSPPVRIDELLYSYSANPDSGWSTPAIISEFSALDMNFGHSLLKFGNLWYMLIPTPASGPNLALYVSHAIDSGWASKGVVISKGAAGAWDDAQVRFVGATYIFGVIYAGYSGYTSGGNLQIGFAMAGADPFSFTKYGENPVLTVGSSGSFDDEHVYSPAIIQYENLFYLWHTGTKVGADREIGLAVIP